MFLSLKKTRTIFFIIICPYSKGCGIVLITKPNNLKTSIMHKNYLSNFFIQLVSTGWYFFVLKVLCQKEHVAATIWKIIIFLTKQKLMFTKFQYSTLFTFYCSYLSDTDIYMEIKNLFIYVN